MDCESVQADIINVKSRIDVCVKRAMKTRINWDNIPINLALKTFIDVIISKWLTSDVEAH